jgi:hypothetical protein
MAVKGCLINCATLPWRKNMNFKAHWLSEGRWYGKWKIFSLKYSLCSEHFIMHNGREILTFQMESTIFRDVTLWSLVSVYWHFREKHKAHLENYLLLYLLALLFETEDGRKTFFRSIGNLRLYYRASLDKRQQSSLLSSWQLQISQLLKLFNMKILYLNVGNMGALLDGRTSDLQINAFPKKGRNSRNWKLSSL